jgi:dCTP deaminase
MYDGRSSKARQGMQSHLSAGFGDLGFKANWTLEILVSQPLKVFRKERIGQVYFMSVKKKALKNAKKYNGKYKNQKIAQPSKNYKDFN